MSAARLLVVTPSLGRGGAERHAVLLATTVDRQRWSPHVLTLADGPLRADLEAAGVTVHLAGTGRGLRALPAATSAVRAAIDEIDPALLSAHDVVGELAARAAVLQRPRPLLAWKHTYGHIGHRGLRDRAIERLSHRLVTRYGAVCHSQVRYLVDELGIDVSRIRVVANSVPIAQDHPIAAAGRPPLVAMVAAMRADKGHASALTAWRRVVDLHPDARLALVGDGPLRGDLIELVATLGLRQNVDFVGAVPDPAVVVARADALLLASYSIECFPYAVLEAMSLAKPVVATDVGGLPELVDDRVTGLLVPPHDALALSHALLELLAEPETARRLGQAGRGRVATAFPFDRWRDQIADLLDETAGVATRQGAGAYA